MDNNEELWPTHILRKKIPNHGEVNAALVKLFQKYHDEHPQAVSRKGVYSSPDNLLITELKDHPAVRQLLMFIARSVFEIATHANERHWRATRAPGVRVELPGVWFQIQRGYGFHETHVHGNSSWSGVYYVQIDEPSERRSDETIGPINGVTRFYGPYMDASAGGYFDFGNLYLQFHSYDSEPEEGVLCVFPSHLRHQAMPYAGKKDRIIVSFNAKVLGKGGAGTNLAYGFE